MPSKHVEKVNFETSADDYKVMTYFTEGHADLLDPHMNMVKLPVHLFPTMKLTVLMVAAKPFGTTISLVINI